MKSLTVNVFFKCNARCVFCVVGLTGGSRATGELDFDEVREQIRSGYEQGCRTVTFSGGEPTVYRGLVEAARYARDLGYAGVEIKTNGIRLAQARYARELVEAGVDLFSISIHGPAAEVHDRLVGVPGAFDRAVAGARLVRELGAELSLPTCIQRDNFELLSDTIALLIELGPRFLLPTFVEPSGSAAFRFDDIVPRYSEVEPYVRRVGAALCRRTDFSWAFHGFPLCKLAGYEAHSYDLVRGDEMLGGAGVECYGDFERAKLRAKAPKCGHCRFESLCGGPWREYVAQRGWDEFEPIEDRRPFDSVPLDKLARAFFPERPAEAGVS